MYPSVTNNSTPKPKVRNSNLELYRILVMLAIVAHHYVVNSGLMNHMVEDPLNPKSIFLFVVGMWGKTGINCFVLITGYFIVCSMIEYIRMKTIEKPLIDYTYNLIRKYLPNAK